MKKTKQADRLWIVELDDGKGFKPVGNYYCSEALAEAFRQSCVDGLRGYLEEFKWFYRVAEYVRVKP